MAFPLAMYQGEDWSQQLSFYADQAQSEPLVFTDPVMDVRRARGLYATFTEAGDLGGLIGRPAPGVLVLSMPWARTALIPEGVYPVDIFADVTGRRCAITKVGLLELVVTARVTVDQL